MSVKDKKDVKSQFIYNNSGKSLATNGWQQDTTNSQHDIHGRKQSEHRRKKQRKKLSVWLFSSSPLMAVGCVRPLYHNIYIYVCVCIRVYCSYVLYVRLSACVSWQASQTTRPDHYRPQTSSMSSSRLSSSSWSSWSSACAAAVHVSGHRSSSVSCRTGRDTSDRMEDGNEKINTSCVSVITEPLASLILAHFLLLHVKSQTVPLATCNHLPWSFNLIHLKHVFIITSITYVFLQFFNHWHLTLYLYSLINTII